MEPTLVWVDAAYWDAEFNVPARPLGGYDLPSSPTAVVKVWLADLPFNLTDEEFGRLVERLSRQ